jgi:hypothetical protein
MKNFLIILVIIPVLCIGVISTYKVLDSIKIELPTPN